MTEWIEIFLPWYSYKHKNSFCGKKLNKPGTLIEMENGDVHLIGTINKEGGVCDDCMDFHNNSIVARYKIVWKNDK